MSNCIFGPTAEFGRRHSARVCSRCGAMSVFLDETLRARFDEDGEKLRTLICEGYTREAPFILNSMPPNVLQLSCDGKLMFQVVERGETLEKMPPG
jgi:hypothetical protein